MSQNERDTKFFGFTKLLLGEIDEGIGRITKWGEEQDELDEAKLTQKTAQVLGTIIMRRSYDLVKHVILHIEHINLDRLTSDECVESIPDLTEWPKEMS